MAGFDVSSKEIPRPSNASLQLPSVRVLKSPFDFPKALVCILEEAVSKGYTIENQETVSSAKPLNFNNSSRRVLVHTGLHKEAWNFV